MIEEKKEKSRNNTERNASSASVFRNVQTVVSIALVMATFLTLWNPFSIFADQSANEAVPSSENISAKQENPIMSTIGIVVGHWQESSGAICEDGLTEVSVNLAIANMVKSKMENIGYAVHLFAENDLELNNFQGLALIAIYTGSCQDSSDNSSGFVIGNTLLSNQLEASNALAACVGEEYCQQTGLPFSYEIITKDHTAYHVFRAINPSTPVILLITGSLLYDREILVEKVDTVAEGIVQGLNCYLNSLTVEK